MPTQTIVLSNLEQLLRQYLSTKTPLDLSSIPSLYEEKYGQKLNYSGKLTNVITTHFSHFCKFVNKGNLVQLYLQPTSSPQNSEPTPFGTTMENDHLAKLLKEALTPNGVNISTLVGMYMKAHGKLNYSGKLIEKLQSVPRLKLLFNYAETGSAIFLYPASQTIPSTTVLQSNTTEEKPKHSKEKKFVDGFTTEELYRIQRTVEEALMTKQRIHLSEISALYFNKYGTVLPLLKGSLYEAVLPLQSVFQFINDKTGVFLAKKFELQQPIYTETEILTKMNTITPPQGELIDSRYVYLIDSIELAKRAANVIHQFRYVTIAMTLLSDQQISLIQIATPPVMTHQFDFPTNFPCVFLFDMQCSHQKDFYGLLQSIFENSNLIKVFYDGKEICELLVKKYHFNIVTIVDILVQFQLFSLLSHIKASPTQQHYYLNPFSTQHDKVGMDALLKSIDNKMIDKKFDLGNDFWKQRPLTSEALEYASKQASKIDILYLLLEKYISEQAFAAVSTISFNQNLSFQQSKDKYIEFDTQHQLRLATKPITVPIMNNLQLSELMECLKELQGFTALVTMHPKRNLLYEIIIDKGRVPKVRFVDNTEIALTDIVTANDLLSIVNTMSTAGIDTTLHRFAKILNKESEVIGLTIRIGNSIQGIATVLQDILSKKSNVLIIGDAKSGKTTLLRDVAKYCADQLEKRVLIFDINNEICGNGDVPHFSVGSSRRMYVSTRNLLANVVTEEVRNHTPQLVIMDEISSNELVAIKSAKQRGIQMVCTTHGNLIDVIQTETNELLGGLCVSILGEEQMKHRKVDSKVSIERKSNPCFDVIVEVMGDNKWRVFLDTATLLDNFVRGTNRIPHQIRFFNEKNEMMCTFKDSLDDWDGNTIQEMLSKIVCHSSFSK